MIIREAERNEEASIMSEINDKTELHSTELVDAEPKKPLVIFKTEEDRYGRDITAMSDCL